MFERLRWRWLLLAAFAVVPLVIVATTGALSGSRHAEASPDRGGQDADSGRIREPRNYTPPRVRLSAPGGVTEFAGMGSCEAGFCYTPGEPVVAVGPSDVVETVNDAAVVYSKTGTKLAEFDFGNFWGVANDNCGDPRALYIASVNRFAISCTDVSNGSPVRFAISKTSDPTAGWYQYSAPNTSFLDQDKIEATADKFVVSGNTGTNEVIYVYNLSDVVGGVSSPPVVTVLAKKSSTYMDVVQQTATSNAYLVAMFPGNNAIDLATITGTPASQNVVLKERVISAKDYPAPSDPQVPGGGLDLDGRIYDAIYEQETSDNHPVIAFSSARECGTRVCSTSVRIDLSTATPVVKYDRLVGEPGWDYSYGAVGLDGAGDPFEAYSRSSSATDAGSAVTGPGFDVTLQPATSGTSTCGSGDMPPCTERWGDYLGTAIDPSDPTSVWVTGLVQESSGSFGWGTVIAKVSASTFSLPTVVASPATKITSTGATLKGTVNPNGVPTTYHIDYGLTSGYDTATTEMSAGSGTTAVPVSAVLTGLQPNMTYHYRIVATTATGSAITADKTFHTTTPKVTAVTFTGSSSNPTVTITGTGFGPIPPTNPPTPLTCFPNDTSYDYGSTGLSFTETTQQWTAGQTGDCIGLIVNSYTTTKIVYQFGAGYSHYGPVTNGDAYKLEIWGATHTGTVSYS